MTSSLLETGSTQLIRNTAAQQLADVQKQHPDELFNLLTKVVPYLRSKSWDTRIAAAKAIGGIVEHAEKFDPNADEAPVKDETLVKSEVEPASKLELPGAALPASEDQLRLEDLDIQSILKYGKKLLGSAGKEYDYSLAALDPAARLALQKKSLTARLGLGGEYIEEDIVSDKDFAATYQPTFAQPPSVPRLDTSHSNGGPQTPAAMTPHDPTVQTPIDESGLSKRQLNQLKRKNKLNAKNNANKVRVVDLAVRRSSTDVPQTPSAPEPYAIRAGIKREESEVKKEEDTAPVDYFSIGRQGGDDDTKVVSEFKGAAVPEKSALQADVEEEGLQWPFERLCEVLMVDLFDHNWEIRHGAAMGIREVVRVHGAGAGREHGKSRALNDLLNRAWLDDLACRLCCVLMLDRFGDYISDNVVAPIRETVGQTLGALLKHLPDGSVNAVYRILYRMVMQDDLGLSFPIWEVCHGGMTGLRYLVAVRNDLLLKDNELIDGVIRAVLKGLGNFDDDVRSVSAATLIPIVQELVTLRPAALDKVIDIVWDCFSDLTDDLSASTGSVMDLLAKLCSFPQVLDAMKRNAANNPEHSFALLVPRLYPFLRHTITSVRSAVLRALLTFVDIEGSGTKEWVDGKILRLMFQNLLVEKNEGVLRSSLQVWIALARILSEQGHVRFAAEFRPHLDPLVTLTLHPIGVSRHPIPMEPSLFMRPSGQPYAPPSVTARKPSPTNGTEPASKRRRKSEKKEEPPPTAHNIDGAMIQGDVDLVGADVLIRSKIYAAQALGKAMSLWPSDTCLEVFGPRLLPHLQSLYSTTQLTTAMILEEYARLCNDFGSPGQNPVETISQTLQPLVEGERPPTYGDLVSYTQVARAQCHSLLNTFREVGRISGSKIPSIAVVVQGDPDAGPDAFSIANAEKIVDQDFDRLKKLLTPAQRVTCLQALNDARQNAITAIEEAKSMKEVRDMRIRAAAASAIISYKVIPKKPSQLIKGVMDSIKKEENIELQTRSANAVASMMEQYATSGRRGPVDKVVSNLVKFCCVDTSETPEFHPNAHLENAILSLRKEEDRRDHPDAAKFEREAREARIMRRGAKEALEQLSGIFKAELFERVPALKSLIESPLRTAFSENLPADIRNPDSTLGQEVVDGLSTIRALVPKFDAGLHPFILELLPLVIKGMQSDLSVLRYAAAKCFATVCSVITVQAMTTLVEKVLPSINNAHEIRWRQGAIECIYHLIHVMEDNILPYVIFLIVPVLGRMSDSDTDIRLLATTSFATLVKLVPLEAGIPDPPGLPEQLLKGRERERKFIAQMLDPRKVEPFEIPVAIKAELRSYQQEGVNWLAFLNRYHLHGVLCDDMGLGKTLQTLCMVASDHHMRAEEFNKTQASDVRRLPSLIVCPPTLSGHWQQEIKTYAPFLSFVPYVGPPADRSRFRSQLAHADVVITSYDICRNDIDVLAPINWNYCVLDEGHLIKNPKAKVTLAVKRLISNHRLILSGTPIQNNVLELWSLFDFLMPGFLGTEKVFLDRFAKPIAASRFSKSSSKEQEAGALAIEALHKQVLPFLLRRLKEEVLDDLPPKIIQNYYCDLSDLQRKLFEDFTKKEGKSLAEKAASGDKESKQHIFQALQYMRKLCNSPALVMKEGHKQYDQVQKQLAMRNTNLRDTAHAPKLTALRDLLVDCGIGANPSAEGDLTTEASYVSPHRALIFCQMKEMLDIVQNDVLRKLLPSVQFLRLDGSVEANRRQSIVNQFNTDPSYDVLLLTTSVGGLGLNLTGADTVIFVEHDWNPQKDMQAMDRAHRIGQKKVVNVYRLITRGTLEEKIMSLQRFKIDVASTVVNQQNAGLGTMETGEILDLFSLGETADGIQNPSDVGNEEDMVDATGEVREKGKKGLLDDLGELWDDKQYEEEYNLDSFLASMKA
ncbi:transcriptional accessory protein [Xylona heveae TC161]|uniref:TATA-binding protein-associated factor mot1 n=1 Tax=Xylona heveae (strain CBS 132557 / TC161) TaxID=1328760 RepID=A0A165GGF5_XYLHT|nr:transcriptional accessory protein [Xylona heveae TC161]KZF22155.1 transcriptional accessory protein [Xylona heveae TC161]